MYTVLMNNDELQHILASYFELTINSKMYSGAYWLKHGVQELTGIYLDESTFLKMMTDLGYTVIRDDMYMLRLQKPYRKKSNYKCVVNNLRHEKEVDLIPV